MIMLGIIIVIGTGAYFLFAAADSLALGAQQGRATVTGREYREMKRTYSTELIGGQTRSVPRVIPEMYVLRLRLNGRETEFSVEQSFYNAVKVGDQVRVTYQRRRLTGAIRIIEVLW